MTANTAHEREFLPDFCEQGNLLRTILMAELLVFVLVAARGGSVFGRLEALALLSLFVQWVAIIDIALLCLAHRFLARLDDRLAATLAFVLLQAVTVVFSVIAHQASAFLELAPAATPLPLLLLENTTISVVVTAVGLRYFYVTAHWRRKIEAEAEARVQALQARIRPHFLFNSMNTIASLTRSSPDDAERAVEDLSELFRASLEDRRLLSVREELALVESYLRIEQQRLGERLRVEWDLDPAAASGRLPALSLQPLVENAVYHGIEQIAAGGCMRIRTQRTDSHVEIEIDNPVPTNAARPRGHRMAQDNVRQRLAHAHGDAAELVTEERTGHYRARLRVPFAEDES